MSRINGVHLLLNYLIRHSTELTEAKPTGPDKQNVRELLEQTRLLNDSLQRIEKLLTHAPAIDAEPPESTRKHSVSSWRETSEFRDSVNSQPTRRSMGNWADVTDAASSARRGTETDPTPHVSGTVMIEKFEPSEADVESAIPAEDYVSSPRHGGIPHISAEWRSNLRNDEENGSRIIAIFIGVAIFLGLVLLVM
jgi:hypothetical protein